MNIKRFFTLAVVIAPLAIMAQTKIATVDVNEVFNALPETKEANATLSNLSAQLKAEYELMQSEFNKKYAAYQAVASDDKVPATIKDRRIQEIQDGDRELNQFLERSKSTLEAQRQALEAPIREKINAALKQVGDKGGYTYILDVSTTPVAYCGRNAVDLTREVKKLLGVE